MTLLHVMHKLRSTWKFQLAVVHINHQLRGKESDGDEALVRQTAEHMAIPFYSTRIDVKTYAHEHKLSKQLAARMLRYQAIEAIRQQLAADVVATAHNANDNAETVLMNLYRGTGIHGLAGIPVKREDGKIIRPLLFAWRKDIEEYVTTHNVEYREDSSNASVAYQRNAFRHRIIPELQRKHPRILQSLTAIATTMREFDASLHTLIQKNISLCTSTNATDELSVHLKAFNALPEFLQSEICVKLLDHFHIEPTEEKVERLLQLSHLPVGKSIELGSQILALHERDNIIIASAQHNIATTQKIYFGATLQLPTGTFSISKPMPVPNAFSGNRNVEFVDAEQLNQHLVLRTWRNGDWFMPFGLHAKKKLSDYFANERIPRHLKSAIPILESNGSIVWVCGKRLDDRFKLTPASRSAVKLTYHPQFEYLMANLFHINGDTFEEYLTEEQIQERIKELAAKINSDFKDKVPIFIGVLNGSFIFLADLIRHITIDCEIDFFKLSSYGDAKISSGQVRLLKDFSCQVEGRDIIIVEDIVDSGLSLTYIKKLIEKENPHSLSFVSLLLKKGLPKIDFPVNYVGFEISPEFVIGYGLDYAQKVRNLRSIYRLAPPNTAA